VVSDTVLRRPDGLLVGTDLGDGPVVVLLHAGGERRQVWSRVARDLAERGYRSVAWDLRGHGDSTAADADRLPAYADDVAAMVRSLDSAATVVGASLGGLAALLALEDSSLQAEVAALVLVDVVPDPDPTRVRAYLRDEAGEIASHPLVDDILDRAQALRRAAGNLDLPTLLIRGGRSPMRGDEITRFTSLVPQARVATIEQAGHLVAHDAPRQLVEQLAVQLREPGVRRRRIDHFLERIWQPQVRHPTGDLADHLLRTGRTLEEWEAFDWICDAGRLHALYGTDGFAANFSDVQPVLVRGAVGPRAERLISLFGRCDRDRSYPTFLSSSPAVIDRSTGEREPLRNCELRALAELTVANELDVLSHDRALAAQHGAALSRLFTSWSPLLSVQARRAVASRSIA
jgi:pimeloyl-ACP methyl ester carboxylesterase